MATRSTGNTPKPYPIILAHGIIRPDILVHRFGKLLENPVINLSCTLDRFHYFKGITSYLNRYGIETYATNVSFAGDLQTRAGDLKRGIMQILQQTGHRKVHIIGHSMGGLDARCMIALRGMSRRVASLTTIGTPHHGSVLIDWALENGAHSVLEPLKLLFDTAGFHNLTRVACAGFNEQIRHHEASNPVCYQTFSCAQDLEQVFLPFQPSWKLIHEKSGANDGLVSVKSQRWKRRLVSDHGGIKKIRQRRFPVRGDHLDQIAWCGLEELDHLKLWNWLSGKQQPSPNGHIRHIYLQIARELQQSIQHTIPTRRRPLN